MANPPNDYWRWDQDGGVTAPDLTKSHTYADHIVKARGKKSQMTSVSSEKAKISNFGPSLYGVLRSEIDKDKHFLVEHAQLIETLTQVAKNGKREEKVRALQALRYAKLRVEGVIEWKFDINGVERKDVITWAFNNIQKYFKKQ